MTPKQVVLGFWDGMRSNDFAKASEWLPQILKAIGLSRLN